MSLCDITRFPERRVLFPECSLRWVIFYTPPACIPDLTHSLTLPSLSAVLRLSSKYLVDPLVQRCLFHLSLDWPLSLSAWDERFTVYPPYPSSSPPSKTFGRGNRGALYIPRRFCPHPILAIQLALEMNLPGILPAAMYDLFRYGPSKILNGTTTPSTTFDQLVAQLSTPSNRTDQSPSASYEICFAKSCVDERNHNAFSLLLSKKNFIPIRLLPIAKTFPLLRLLSQPLHPTPKTPPLPPLQIQQHSPLTRSKPKTTHTPIHSTSSSSTSSAPSAEYPSARDLRDGLGLRTNNPTEYYVTAR